MIVREAIEADLAAILAIYAQPELDDGDVMSIDEARAHMQRLRAYPFYKLYVADDAGTIVGTFALLVMDNLAHRGAPSAIVEDVGVAPELQGRGVGKQMMAHAMKLAADAGCYKLVLSSNRRRTSAHAFYESLGFSQHGLSFVVQLPQAGTH
jgi:GNAT superfamily N-acetyltransferase